ncbi:MAG: sensor histidine kinase [Caulobacteraceae bacterium]
MKITSLLRPLRRDRPLRGVAVSAALFGLAVVVRWRFGALTEGFGPMLLLPAILLAGVFGGIRVGLGACVVCLLVAWIWFFPPYGTLYLEPREAATVTAFILTAILELYVIRVLNLAISDLSDARERTATMFRELQHRVANNLQVVAAVLRHERRGLDQGSAAARALETAQNRLDLMVKVHRSLNSPNIVENNIGTYFQDMGNNLISSSNTQNILFSVVADPITLDVERLMSLSMIVAEAITNALKYAFQGRPGGKLAIGFHVSGRDYVLTVCDDGPGFSPTAYKTKNGSLGRKITESLASQLRGKVTFESAQGTTVRVVFPIDARPRTDPLKFLQAS